jgi:hypothetical protein
MDRAVALWLLAALTYATSAREPILLTGRLFFGADFGIGEEEDDSYW